MTGGADTAAMTVTRPRIPATFTQTLHLVALWVAMERRARTHRRHGTLITTMPGMAITANHEVSPARTALVYRPADPYALTLWISAADHTYTATIARDLITEALTRGTSGYHQGTPGPVHVALLNHTWTGVSLDTPDGHIALTVPTRRLRRAARTWSAAIPPGTETTDISTVEDHLAQAA